MIAGYNELLTRMQQMISGDDVNADSVESNILGLMVQMAEQRIYNEVRSRWNEKAFTGTVTSNAYPLPADFVACSSVYLSGSPMEPVSEEWARRFNADHGGQGQELYFAEAGNSLIFAPELANATTVLGRYFFRYPTLTADNFSSNLLAVNAPDAFLYAGLSEAAPMFEQDGRIQLWEARYQAVKNRLNTEKTRAAYSAGRIRVRPSTQLMG